MFGIKTPGLSNVSPKNAMTMLINKAQESAGVPINHLIMEVDFNTEEMIFKLPEYKRLERHKNSMMFMLISSAMKMEFSNELEGSDVLALEVDFKRDGALHSKCYYIKNDEKLFTSKTV